MSSINAERIPVTVLTGYLGAGKTTLLNRILADDHGYRLAVIVNEFGELGIDGDLVVGSDEDVLVMNNGCICCTVRGDLIRIIGDLLDSTEEFDGIVIETTGLAHPAPVAQTFFMDPKINARTRLDAIIAVADAKHLGKQLAGTAEAEAQIASADLVLLNKCDLVETRELDASEALVRAVNPFAEVTRTVRSDLAVNQIFERRSFDLERVLERLPTVAVGAHGHTSGVQTVSLEAGRPLVMERFLLWMDSLLERSGDDMLRTKGILAFEGQSRRFVFQSVHRISDGDFLLPASEPRGLSRLVFIGRHLDPDWLRRNFEACQAPCV